MTSADTIHSSQLFARLTARSPLRPKQIGKLLHELHNKCSFVGIKSVQRICDGRQLIVRPLRPSLQKLIYRTIQRITELL